MTRTITVALDSPPVWISLSGCSYAQGFSFCIGTPQLLFTGEETLPNHQITRITVQMDGTQQSCEGSTCTIPLDPTDENGTTITFWGDSSFGDSTPQYSAIVRVMPVDGYQDGYSIDVISEMWLGKNPPSCSDIWQVLPDPDEENAWLETPQDASDLQRSVSLYYLAASLIRNGLVDASACENGGLETDYTANECGLSMASPQVEYWQNRFDQEILQVARADGVPARLLKNLFIRESQLWPGIYHDVREVGLGQLT